MGTARRLRASLNGDGDTHPSARRRHPDTSPARTRGTTAPTSKVCERNPGTAVAASHNTRASRERRMV